MQALTSLNFEPVFFPLLDIHYRKKPLTELEKDQLTEADLLIFLSQNALIGLAPYWQENHRPCLAIGPATAEKLREAGYCEITLPNTYDSEGVLALPILQKITGKKIGIICGENPRPLLQDTLSARGAIVNTLITYQRKMPQKISDLSPWMQKPIASILITSENALQNLCALFSSDSHWLYAQQLLVVSQKTGQSAMQLGFNKTPWVSQNATQEAILDCLQKHMLV